VTQQILSHTYDNGLTLVAEPMPSLESAALTILVPCGAAYDPQERSGLAAVTVEMSLRGAGPRNSRQLIEDLENLGVHRGESVSASHTSFGGATLAKNLPAVLNIYADILQRPHLPADQLEAGRSVAIQELRSIEDDPAHKVVLEVRRRFFPWPWGRPAEGTIESLEAISIDDVRDHYGRLFRPAGTILGIAGRIEWEALRDQVGELFGQWRADDVAEPPLGPRGPRQDHLPHDSHQTQIGIAYPTVPYRHPDYFQASGALRVLSGGMSSRLFTEVREKRGLCYSVFASYHTLRDEACVLCYAGTSADRAQQTLDVMLAELRRLAEGIEPHELDRVKARVKSALIMQQESSSARSAAIAGDWYHLGRVRALDEIHAAVDALTCESIAAYLARNPPRDFTVVTLGPRPLEMPVGAMPD
jgi:predicted Zn-dependent peptidase